jgi:Raf kinase inhibitor-like YbhB/YbcL family protein
MDWKSNIPWMVVFLVFAGCTPDSNALLTDTPSPVQKYALDAVKESISTAYIIPSIPRLADFILTSPGLPEGGALPAEYTCDGAASTLPLVWSGAPAGTQSFAVIMHHVASPTDVHWYWVLYDIPPDVTSLPKNVNGIGTLGTNSVNGRNEYTPPCSKGPGLKTYTYTVYALSALPKIGVPAAQVTRAVLLDALQGITLASAELHVTYTRPFGSTPQVTPTETK